MKSNWTDERVALLKELWPQGFSASVIAAKIGGVSRNGVIGKVHRLGMAQKRQAGYRPARKGPRKAVLAPVRMWHPNIARTEPPQEPTPIPPPAADDIARVQFDQLEPHHCRFVPGEPKDGFCGLDKVPGTSYCAGHLARCTTSPTPKNFSDESKVVIAKNLRIFNAKRFGSDASQLLHAVDLRNLETIA
jgi:GcrA cell cycle regulator